MKFMLLFLFVPFLALAEPGQANLVVPFFKNIAVHNTKIITQTEPVIFNCYSESNWLKDHDFGEIGEYFYSLASAINKWTETQTFWRPRKGLIIPLAIINNPLEVSPELNYNASDNRKNKFTLTAYLMF